MCCTTTNFRPQFLLYSLHYHVKDADVQPQMVLQTTIEF